MHPLILLTVMASRNPGICIRRFFAVYSALEILLSNFWSSLSAAHGIILYISLTSLPVCDSITPIFIALDLFTLSSPAKNQWSCCSMSFQFWATFPVNARWLTEIHCDSLPQFDTSIPDSMWQLLFNLIRAHHTYVHHVMVYIHAYT